MKETRPILLFDGDCVLCSGWVDFILRWEAAPDIVFVAAQSPAGQSLLTELGLPLADWESNFLMETRAEERVLHFKSDAAIAVLKRMRTPVSWLAWSRIAPKVLRNWIYDRVARNRYAWFGRRQSCRMPTPALQDRFL